MLSAWSYTVGGTVRGTREVGPHIAAKLQPVVVSFLLRRPDAAHSYGSTQSLTHHQDEQIMFPLGVREEKGELPSFGALFSAPQRHQVIIRIIVACCSIYAPWMELGC